ncbi:MAG: hypothetical protein XD84_1504 [Desulfotomaculum sp. 46_80]|nr:MAG: hypothetical protein XD84_1504 [Desulfotomaculum sp. 46_80]
MIMSDEKSRILQMFRNGKISVEEGVELLDALDDTVNRAPVPGKKLEDRFLTKGTCGRRQGQSQRQHSAQHAESSFPFWQYGHELYSRRRTPGNGGKGAGHLQD